jgi:hypothetical protein
MLEIRRACTHKSRRCAVIDGVAGVGMPVQRAEKFMACGLAIPS